MERPAEKKAKAIWVPVLLAMLALSGHISAQDPEDLPKQVRELREQVDTLQKQIALYGRVSNAEQQIIDERLKRLEKAVSDLNEGQLRKNFTVTPEPLATSTVRLDNRLGVEARVTIEGVEYTVAPLSVRTIRNLPVGNFTYRVTADGFGIGPNRRTRLNSNETWTLRIF